MAEPIEKVDLLCKTHDVALVSPRGRITILVPDDQYGDEPDYGLGWRFNLDELECPNDPEVLTTPKGIVWMIGR